MGDIQDTGLRPVELVEDGAVIAHNGSGSVVHETSSSIGNQGMCVEGPEDPHPGMTFQSLDEAVQYYQDYGKCRGFSIIKASGGKGGTMERKYQTLKCHRYGKNRPSAVASLQPRPTNKIGCGARLCVAMADDRRWRVTKVVLDHSHDLSPTKSRFIRQHRVIAPHVKARLQLNDIAGIRTSTSFRSIVHDAGGYDKVGCSAIDCRNFVIANRSVRLGEGDAHALHNMFMRMQAGSRDFFYHIDPDSEGRLRNVFWADARSRAAYEEFGDVVTFDTTYLVNRYNMPFAPFVGVNHHGQSTLFGCALIANEESETFEWVFNTWLACMRNRPPKGIITDQCRSMTKAIKQTMPNTRHRFCLWHILKKLPEKLNSHSMYDSLRETLLRVVYDSVTVECFEQGWADMLVAHNIANNEWLASIYEVRKMWVPAYVKGLFWAGMSSTQRSEGINAFFDGYVHSRTTLKQFVEQYEIAMKAKIEKEIQMDFKSNSSTIPCITKFPFEKQFQEAYTHKMFREVQYELNQVMYCEVDKVSESGNWESFKVLESEFNSHKEGCPRPECTVSVNVYSGDVSCECRLFEFKGILCRHAFRVFGRRKVHVINDKFLLRRWRKDVVRCHSKVLPCHQRTNGGTELNRIREMESVFYSVADMASQSDDRCLFLIEKIKEVGKTFETWESSVYNNTRDDLPQDQVCNIESVEANNNVSAVDAIAVTRLLDPHVGKPRGRPRGKRLQSSTEVHSRQAKRRRRQLNTCRESDTRDSPLMEIHMVHFCSNYIVLQNCATLISS